MHPPWRVWRTPIEAIGKARQAAKKALGIDEGLGEAHGALAHILFAYDWDHRAAEKEYQRASHSRVPRLGFNYRLKRFPGFLDRLTGDDGSVIRGGYARTYDVAFVQIARQIPGTFPFVKSVSLAPRTPNSLEALRNAAATPITGDTSRLSRTRLRRPISVPRSPNSLHFSSSDKSARTGP